MLHGLLSVRKGSMYVWCFPPFSSKPTARLVHLQEPTESDTAQRGERPPPTLRTGSNRNLRLNPHVKGGEPGYRNPSSNPPRGFNGTSSVWPNPERPG